MFTTNPFSNRLVLIGIGVSISLHLILVYVLPEVGFNPFRVEPFPAWWWIVIVSLGFLGLLLVELEEFVVDRARKFFAAKPGSGEQV